MGVVSFNNCCCCHHIIIPYNRRGEPSWMRVEPAINTGVVPSIYVGALRPIWIPYCLPQPCIKLGTNSAPPARNSEKLLSITPECPCLPLPAPAARFVLTLSSNVCIMAGWVRGAIACRCVGVRKCSTRLGRDCTPPTTAVAPLGTVIFKDDPQGSCLYSSLWPSVL